MEIKRLAFWCGQRPFSGLLLPVRFTFYYVLLHFRHFFAHFAQNLLLHGLQFCIWGCGRVRRGSRVVDGIFSHAIQLRHINLVGCRTEPPSAWFGRFRTTRRFSGRWRSLLEIFTLSRIILKKIFNFDISSTILQIQGGDLCGVLQHVFPAHSEPIGEKSGHSNFMHLVGA